MIVKATNNPSTASGVGQSKLVSGRTKKKRSHVTEARAKAQRARLDSQTKAPHLQERQEIVSPQTPNQKTTRKDAQAKRRVITTLIEAYIQDHIGENASKKTVEWHRTALGLMQLFLHEQLDITHIDEVEADDISAWVAHLRTSSGANGKVSSERTIQTYARPARAFFHWLVRRETLERRILGFTSKMLVKRCEDKQHM